MQVKLFVREGCPGCPAATRACQGIVDLAVYDIGDPADSSEAALAGVELAPSVLVVDSSGREIAGWRGKPPTASDLRAVLAN